MDRKYKLPRRVTQVSLVRRAGAVTHMERTLSDKSSLSTRIRKAPRRVVASAMVLVLASVLVLLPLIAPIPFAQEEKGALELTTDTYIYRTDQNPVFTLKTTGYKPGNTLGWLGVGRAYAAISDVKTKVTYKGTQVDIPVEVQEKNSREYELKINPKAPIKPGQYKLEVTTKTEGQAITQTENFAWGVLAINTTKASYTPGEKVILHMAVLSSSGKTLCTAPLKLTITDNQGRESSPEVQRPEDCKPDQYTDVPDYSAMYTAGGAGVYTIKLQLADSQYTITDTFEVVKSQPLSVERTGPTRLFPPSPYTMKLKVTAKQYFRGVVTERLPAGFTVENPGSAIIEDDPNGAILKWNISMSPGATQELSYMFKSPQISPAFYFFGALTMTEEDRIVYQEARRWQMAGDAVIALLQQVTIDVAATTSYTITISTTAGSALVLMMGNNGNSGAAYISSITDSNGTNTWVKHSTSATNANPPAAYNGTGPNYFTMAYSLNTTAVTSVTVNLQSSAALSYSLTEWSNVATTSAVDQSMNGNAGATTTPTTPVITTTNADNLIIGGMNSTTNTYTSITNGFTALGPGGNTKLGGGYKIVSATGAYSFGYTTSSNAYGSGIMAFKTAVDPGTPSSCDSGAAMPIVFVKQTAVNVASGAASTTSVTSTAGNTLLLILSMKSTPAGAGSPTGPFNSSTIADSAANTWVYPTTLPSTNPPAIAITGSNSYVSVSYALNTAAITSITITPTVTAQPYSYNLVEFSGIATASAVDQSDSGTNSAATSHSTPTITTTNPNDLIVGALSGTEAGGFTLTSSGYSALTVLQPDGTSFRGVAAYKSVNTTGTQSVNWTTGASASTGAGIIAFKAFVPGVPMATTDYQMRGGNYFCSGAEVGFFWAR